MSELTGSTLPRTEAIVPGLQNSVIGGIDLAAGRNNPEPVGIDTEPDGIDTKPCENDFAGGRQDVAPG